MGICTTSKCVWRIIAESKFGFYCEGLIIQPTFSENVSRDIAEELAILVFLKYVIHQSRSIFPLRLIFLLFFPANYLVEISNSKSRVRVGVILSFFPIAYTYPAFESSVEIHIHIRIHRKRSKALGSGLRIKVDEVQNNVQFLWCGPGGGRFLLSLRFVSLKPLWVTNLKIHEPTNTLRVSLLIYSHRRLGDHVQSVGIPCGESQP